MADTVRIELAVEAVDNTGQVIDNIVNSLQKLKTAAANSQGSLGKEVSDHLACRFKASDEADLQEFSRFMRDALHFERLGGVHSHRLFAQNVDALF